MWFGNYEVWFGNWEHQTWNRDLETMRCDLQTGDSGSRNRQIFSTFYHLLPPFLQKLGTQKAEDCISFRTWNRDKKSWRGETVKLRILLRVKVLGGEILKMTWNRDKKSWGGMTVKLRILLHVRFRGGKFKKWLGIVTRSLGEGRLWSWEYSCM